MSSSRLLRIIPEQSFDVHVLRTVKRDLITLLTQLQASLPRPSDSINQVIYILNQTFNDVELCYLVWRHERVQTTLQHGFQYSRARVTAALWRRNQGRPPAAFPGFFPALQGGGMPPQPANQPPGPSWPRSPTNGGAMQYPANLYGAAVPAAGAWNNRQGQLAQQYAAQNTPGQSPVGALPGYPQFQTPAMGSPGGSPYEVAPPPYPPPNWKPPSPIPGSPPVSTEVIKAVEVAISYLEAVNKAINICIDANAL